MIEYVAQQQHMSSFSLLEVAAGSGYVPKAASRRLTDRGIQLDITLLDRARSHLGNGTNAVVGDALALPFPDASFDLVSSSLFMHHFSPEYVVQFINESLRVCRHAVLVNDLVRSPMHFALAYAGCLLYRSRLTRHDAPASVRQAYTVREMNSLLRQTNAAKAVIDRHYFLRMGIIAWKH
jgi:ubiquinone/menaquinone biosynthesis C-methylase UbiE